MSFERRRGTTADAPSVANPRRGHLEVLCAKVNAHPNLGAGFVERLSVVVLNVTCVGAVGGRGLSQEICCDLFGETWWFIWANDGARIAPVSELDAALGEIVEQMGAGS
ncbi:hypothetical protein SMC26_17850 [Actinomadura fulvescens]|uniref:Uncharacterized protein n=1 Tax=Actinomadura fulvescens TaxID=46160 RepID=A0ABP6C8B3_9ACTN